MKLLLVVDERTDPVVASGYVARRFGARDASVDVLAIIPGPGRDRAVPRLLAAAATRHRAELARSKEAVDDLAHATARELRTTHGLAVGTTHLRAGDPARVIAASGARLGSDLVLMEQPAGGFHARLRAVSLARSLLADTACVVEFFAPAAPPPDGTLDVVVPLALEDIVQFPVIRMCDFAWPASTRWRILGITREPSHATKLEACGYRILRTRHEAQAIHRAVQARLRTFCGELRRVLGASAVIDHEIVTGTPSAVMTDVRRRQPNALMVALESPSQGFGRLAALTQERALAMALRAAGSTLLLHGARGDAALRHWLSTSAMARARHCARSQAGVSGTAAGGRDPGDVG